MKFLVTNSVGFNGDNENAIPELCKSIIIDNTSLIVRSKKQNTAHFTTNQSFLNYKFSCYKSTMTAQFSDMNCAVFMSRNTN